MAFQHLSLPNGILNADTFERIFEMLNPSLGEIMCDEKSNEITAILELLEMLNVEKAIVTIDAMGTQTKIAEGIIAQKADYCLALKGNHSSIRDDVRLYFETEAVPTTRVTSEKGHG